MHRLLLVATPILWNKSPIGIFKINWEVDVDKGYGRIRIGIVVRDHKGVVLAARSTPKNILVDLVVVEALSTLCAVKFSKDMSFHDIILEGDALQIVHVVKAGNKNWSKFGHLSKR